MSRVLASAVVDIVSEPLPGQKGKGHYKVEVWGKEPHDFVRIYTIYDKSDTLAAQEGIRRFVEEMEQLENKTGN